MSSHLWEARIPLALDMDQPWLEHSFLHMVETRLHSTRFDPNQIWTSRRMPIAIHVFCLKYFSTSDDFFKLYISKMTVYIWIINTFLSHARWKKASPSLWSSSCALSNYAGVHFHRSWSMVFLINFVDNIPTFYPTFLPVFLCLFHHWCFQPWEYSPVPLFTFYDQRTLLVSFIVAFNILLSL